MTPIIETLHDYGWAGVALVLVADKVLPSLSRFIFPSIQKKQQADLDSARLEQDARLKADGEERAHRHQVELRTVNAIEQIRDTYQSMEKILVSVNDRLGGIEYELKVQEKSHPRKPARKTRKT